MKPDILLNRLLARTRGYYFLAVTVLVQLLSIPGGLLGVLVIHNNANFSQFQLQTIAKLVPLAVLVDNLLLLVMAWYLTSNARRLLHQRLQAGKTVTESELSLAAWRETTAYSWKYGVIALPLGFVLDVVAPSMYLYLRGYTIFDQLIYSLLGGFAALLVVIILTVILLDRMLLPARAILLPSDSDTQTAGIAGAPVGWKLSLITMALVGIAIILIAPIGYHQIAQAAVNIFDPEQIIRNEQIRREMQVQFILVGSATVLLNLALIYAISRSFTNPISTLIETFKEIEKGNLTRRVEVTSTDEIGTLAIQFNRMIARLESFQTSLEEQVQERTKQLEAINEVGRAANAILDPDELIEKVADEYEPQANAKSQKLTVEKTEAAPNVRGDAQQLTQALRNIVGNAIKYTPQGGEIHITQETTEKEIAINVVDTGYGISAEELPMIFKRFYRVRTNETSDIEGNGLGLAIVKSVIEQHGGQVSAQSETGKGTRFRISLPLPSMRELASGD